METEKQNASGQAGAADLSQNKTNRQTEIHTDEAEGPKAQLSPCEVPDSDLKIRRKRKTKKDASE